MSEFPVVFTPADTTNIVEETTNLSFFFEPVEGFTFLEQKLPFFNDVKGYQLFLKGKFTEPSFAFTRKNRTQTYMLETIYLAPLCPTFVAGITPKCPTDPSNDLTEPTRNSLIIKGSILEYNVKKTIYLYIPFVPPGIGSGTQVNLFEDANTAIVAARRNRETKVTGEAIDLNSMVPRTPFRYHDFNTDGQSNMIIFFDTSSILLDPSLIAIIKPNILYNKRTTNKTFNVFESINAPEMKRITPGMEDSIYIDCMPVELVNEEKKTFFKDLPTLKGANGLPAIPMPNIQGLNYATDLIDQTTSYLEKASNYILFLVFLALMVYLIFSVKKMFNASTDDAEEEIMPLLKEIQKKTAK